MTTAAPATTPSTKTATERSLQCPEIWGGNHAVDAGISIPGLDAWVYSEPYEHSTGGGDVHYVSSCATGRVVRVLLADVAGHGDGAATLAITLRNLMRRYVNSLKQVEFVNALNRSFFKQSEGFRFATGVVASYWGPKSTLTVSIAGHPLPLLYKARTKEWSLLGPPEDSDAEARNLPLGVDDDAVYDTFDVKLDAGDVVLLYTDALIETEDDQGQLLGEGGILEEARKLDPTDPGALITKLREVISPEIDRQTDQDDVTLMALRCTGGAVQTRPWSLLVGAVNTVKAMVRK